MAITQVIAGAYTSTFGGSNLNYTRRGFTLHFTGHAELVNETDTFAKTLLDQIGQGLDISIECICRIYAAAALTAFWPWGVTIGTVSTTAAPMARRGTDIASSLILTAVAGTPAAISAAPATATGALAILAPETDHSLVFSSTARDVPVSWNLLPSETGGTTTKIVLT